MLEIMRASAGSGKTYRLARKYIELLLESKEKFAYRHILAVTFTNKATDEMKSRILKELHILATNPSDSGYYGYFVPSPFPSAAEIQKKSAVVLSDILHDYSAFAVSTIDRFFQQTLKAFSREIGQFASYQLELDKNSLVSESVDRILDSLTEDDSSLLTWLTDNVLEQIEQGERYSLDANLMDMAMRLKSQQREVAREKAGLISDEEYPKEKLMEIREICRKIATDFRVSVREKSRAVLSLMEDAGVNPADSNRAFLQSLYNYSELDDNEQIIAPSESFINKALDSNLWFAKSKAAKLRPLVYPFIEAPLEEFCALFDKEFKIYNTALIIDKQLYGLGVAGELDKAFKELMKEKNVLCIDDSNTILRDIIDGSDAPFVYEKLGVRYEHFLLDEFQDTANIQWANFSPLLHESDAKGGDNLIVGDVKQSIYRWRGSDWKLLNETVPQEFTGHREEVLDSNFRSLANIVNFNNLFFKTAAEMLERHCGGSGLSDIYSDVTQKVGRKAAAKGSVSLSFCDRDSELDRVLDAVQEVLTNGAKLSEIAVLVRSNAIGESVAMHLIDNGIPVMTDDSLRVKTAITVRRLVSLLSYADNPNDTVNAYLAESMNITLSDSCISLVDMVESLFRSLKEKDEEALWKGESMHIQSFMDYVCDYVSQNGNNLRGFLKYWEGENPSISSASSGESVRIMTIHKSKGLVFPYVIIPFVESVNLYKSGKYWCAPALGSSPLKDVAEGVYDVNLSKSSEDTLFSEDYRKEYFLQMVDNINTIYVAMTRAALGMHLIAKTPSAKCLKAIDAGNLSQFSDFSQILYWYAVSSSGMDVLGNEELLPPFEVQRTVTEEEYERFDIGDMVDFGMCRKQDVADVEIFPIDSDDELPSIALKPSEGEPVAKERGRLKNTPEASDIFSEEGETGIAASKRIKGVVLHDILARVKYAEDLDDAVNQALLSGELTPKEAMEAAALLSERIASVADYGWFPDRISSIENSIFGESPGISNCISILNEVDIIDENGELHRPDRVIISDCKVKIIDYKFGEHCKSYERQLRRYAELYRKMGYQNVETYLWYVQKDEVVSVKLEKRDLYARQVHILFS